MLAAGVVLAGLAGLGEWAVLAGKMALKQAVALWMGSALIAVPWAANEQMSEAQRRSRKIAKLTKDLKDMKALREYKQRMRRGGVYQRTLEGVINIIGEDDERIRRELERANSREEREWIYKKIERRIEERVRRDRGRQRIRAQAVDASHEAVLMDGLVGKNRNKILAGLIGIAENGNRLLEEGNKAMHSRNDNLLGGFAKMKITRPKDEPLWMWD